MTATVGDNLASQSLTPKIFSAERVWLAIRQLLELELPVEQFTAYVAKTNVIPSSKPGSELKLLVPTEAAAVWMRENLLDRIKHLAQNIHTGQITICARSEPPLLEPAALAVANSATNTASGLAPQFVFDTFVPGPSNEIALTAALKLATEPQAALTTSPLYIHGSVGLGKTHLAHAIGNRFLANRPQARLRVLSGEQFMREVQDNFMNNRIQKFRARFRNLDLLIIDDIQMIGRDSEQTHKQFLGLFNFMTERNLPIVLTSDCPVKRLAQRMPGRLISRIAMGVDVIVATPDLDTRIAIVRSQARILGLALPVATAQLIATQLRNNCRELIGALKRLALRAEHLHCPLSVELAREILAEISSAAVIVSINDIIEQTARHFNLRLADLQSKRRTRSLVTPRHVAMFLCRELTQFSLPAIGDAFRCHHSSILHAWRKISSALHTDPELANEVIRIRQELAS